MAQTSTVDSVSARPAPPGGFFGSHWPDPVGPAVPVVLGAVAVTGLAAAVLVPPDRPGAGWLATGLVAAAGTAAVARRAGRPAAPARRTGGAVALRLAWAVAALALLAVGTVRAAGWLFALCVIGAVIAAAQAVAGGRTVQGIVASVLVQPVAVARALPWAGRGLASVRTRQGDTARLGMSLLVTAVLLLVFGSLLGAADAAFTQLTTSALPYGFMLPGGLAAGFLFGAGALAAAYLMLVPARLDSAGEGPRRTLHRLEWTVPLAMLDLLFAAFVAVQVTVLFGGAEHVLRTAGLTYAEYARSGFWQLLVVTVLALTVLSGAARWAPRRTRADRLWVRVLLGTLATLMLVVVASALYRMQVYAQAYGLTRLRLLVAAMELGLGGIFLLVLAAGVRLRGGWLPRAALALGLGILLGLAVLNPDRFIAEHNVARYEETKLIDLDYLSRLSADAVPALDRLPDDLREDALRRIARDLGGRPDGWRAWNHGRETARSVLDPVSGRVP